MENKNSMWFWIAAIIIVVVGVGYYLSQSQSQQTSSPAEIKKSGPIKIGFLGPLTGDASSLGTVARAAAEVAIEEVNAAGGINGRTLEMIAEDGQCNAKAATNAANKLMNVDKVPVIIGGLCSTETSAFGPSAMEKKTLVFSYGSSAPKLSELGKYFFRSYPSDLNQGKFAAEYLANELKVKKVAILYHVSDWGNGIKGVFEARFKELGGEIVAVEGAPQDSRDYRTALSKIKASNPDYIYSPMYPDGSMVALKQAKEMGVTKPFFGGDAWADTKLQADVSGMGDIIFTEPFTPENKEFTAKVLAKTKGEQVGLGAPQAYDNVKMLAKVMTEVGTDPDKLQEALRAITFEGVSGNISFDQNGDIKTAVYVVRRIKDGKAELVK